MTAWQLETGHFAERFQLFVILALGESIVVTGATAARARSSTRRGSPRSRVAFLGTAAMWWLYFDYARGDRPAAARAGARTARRWRATPTPTCTS